jgi:hypothetical protein
VRLQCFQRDLDGAFELRIVPSRNGSWIVFHFNVGRYAVILYFPLVVQSENRHTRSGNEAAIHQWRVVINADKPAPGSRSDERPYFVLFEHPWQSVAAGARHFVDDHRLRAVDLRERRAELLAFTSNVAIA